MSIALNDTGRFYEPTQLQLSRARQQGKVPRSHEVSSCVVIAVGLIVLGLVGPVLLRGLREMVVKCLGGSFSGRGMTLMEMFSLTMKGIILPTAALIFGLVAAAIIGGFMQVGNVFSTKRFRLDAERLSLLAGAKRLFSGESFMLGLFAILKFTLVGLSLFATLRNHWGAFGGNGEHGGMGGFCEAIASSLRELGICIGLGLAAIALADYLWQRYRWRRSLMMTRGEWLEDIRQMSGSSRDSKKRKRHIWNVKKISAERGQRS